MQPDGRTGGRGRAAVHKSAAAAVLLVELVRALTAR